MIKLHRHVGYLLHAGLIYFFYGLLPVCLVAATGNMNNDRAVFTLNGLRFEVDKKTGGILHLSSASDVTFLETSPARSGLVDLAVPVPAFEPLRRATRYSEQVRIDQKTNDVSLYWNDLPPSRPLSLKGNVPVTVRFRAAQDGRSVILTCRIENNSEQPIRQVLFPDLTGLLPFAGEKQTRFRSGAFVSEPFILLRPDAEMVPFYATGPFKAGNGWIEYKSGRYKEFSQKLFDWFDFGGAADGFSMYARRWPSERPDISIMMHLAETDNKLRLLFSHLSEIQPGETWQSDEYWITPHIHGWAEGIEPFRDWAAAHLGKSVNLPDHIRDGLGFRSLWMGKGIPADGENDVLYKYKDLPRIAKESSEHGLYELVPWFWSNYFDLPIQTISTLGSIEDLQEAVKACRTYQVNVSLFVTVLYLRNPSAAHYGLTPVKETAWTYHPELIPHYNPPYASRNEVAMVDQTNLQWQADVLASLKKFMDRGLDSFVWDVFMASPTTPNLYDLAAKIRTAAGQKNTQAVFAGEGGCNLAEDSKYLDYTWNWNWNWPHYKDFRAYTSVFRAPRLNVNIDESVKVINYCFADNAFMNVMVASPDGINASDLIVNHPAVSDALKRAARLRRQFLAYFREGRLIGECLVLEETPAAHISAYVLPEKILMIVAKDESEGRVSLTCDLSYWLGHGKRQGLVNIYSATGDLIETQSFANASWRHTTQMLAANDIRLYEFTAGEEERR